MTTMENPSQPPWWPPTLSRAPAAPERHLHRPIAFTVFGVGGVLWGLYMASRKPIDWTELGGEIEDPRPTGWVAIVVFALMAGLAFWRWGVGLREHARRMQQHNLRVQRLVPAWARVESSAFGARRTHYTEGAHVLVGHQLQLQLAVFVQPTGAPRSLSVHHDFEPHVATALAPGVWLEVAYDAEANEIVPQQLVTREGARVPVLPIPHDWREGSAG